jgi:hypothetical protein
VRGQAGVNRCRKNHVANVPNDVVLRRIVESPIVDEPVGHMPWSGPSTHGLRCVPMSHVAVKVPVAGDLEKHNLAVVRPVPVRLEAANGRFQLLNIRCPRITEKSVSYL